ARSAPCRSTSLFALGPSKRKSTACSSRSGSSPRRSSAPASSGSQSLAQASYATCSRYRTALWPQETTPMTIRLRRPRHDASGPCAPAELRCDREPLATLEPVHARAEEAAARARYPDEEGRHHLVGPALDRGAPERPSRRFGPPGTRAHLCT